MFKSSVRRKLGELALSAVGEGQRIRFLREYERSQFWSTDQLQELQLERATRILNHAYDNCPFYRERFAQRGVLPSTIRSLEDWPHLPVLEKRDIQHEYRRMRAVNWPATDTIVNQTGGSTGQPLRFYLHKDRLESRCGATMRHDGWAGLKLGDRVAYVWGAPRDIPQLKWRTRCRQMLLGHELWLDTAHITEPKLRSFLDALVSFRPRTIVGYAGGLALLAKFVLANGIAAYQPASIIASAELLLPEDRQRIEQAFGCKVFNRYGCREVAVVASECEVRDGLHVMAEGLFIEVVTEPLGCTSGSPGAILVTDLLNFAMPLIRYRIGDLGAWASGSCPCGRGLPRLSQINGRVTDFLVGADGRLVSGVFLATYVVAQRPTLGQVQIIQSRKGHVVYRLCPSDHYDPGADNRYLRESTKDYLGPGSTADIELADRLSPEVSGKILFSKSSVQSDFVDTGTA